MTTTQPETTFHAEPGQKDFTISAIIDAPVDKVFRAYVEPELLVGWWGPAELTSEVEVLEMHTGGRWRIVQTDADGNEYGFHGVVHEVVENSRIVQTFEFDGMPGHVSLEVATFDDVDGKTRITSQAVYLSVEDRDGMAQSGAESFASVGMAQLAEVVAAL